MAKPRLIRALAYHRPGPHHAGANLPTREMWVRRVPDGVAALAAHPVFQLTPLHASIREMMLNPLQQRRILKEASLTENGPSEVLIWCPHVSYYRDQDYIFAEPPAALYDPYYFLYDRENLFTRYHHWIGMTRDRVWATGGGDRDHLILGAYVHLVERLDVHGNPLPAEPQGAIPEADEDALGTLAP